MKRLIGVYVLALLTLGAQCQVNPPEPKPAPDVYIPPDEPGACEKACQRLTELGCEEATPTDAGDGCLEVCENAGEHLDLACVVRAKACAEVNTCVR